MSQSIENLVSQIVNKEFVGANSAFEEILNSKIQDLLDEEEMKIAAKIYNDLDYDEIVAEEFSEEEEDDEDFLDDESLEEGNRGLYQKIKPGDHIHYKSNNDFVKAKVLSKGKRGELAIDHGDGKTKYVYTSDIVKHEPAGVKEETEELDEISGATLGSYYVKANKSKDAEREKAKGTMDKFMKSNPETMQKNLPKAQAEYDKHTKKASNRQKGMNRAMDKLTGSGFARVHAKESVEDLEELSRDTVRRYIRTAHADNVDRKERVMRPFKLKDINKNTAEFKKMKSREKGIETAGKKAYDMGGKARVPAK